MRFVVGVDPGRTGAVAVLDRDGDLEAVFPLDVFGTEPNAMEFAAQLEAIGPRSEVFIGVEEPFANNRASSISQMNQGIGYGVLLGVIGAGGYRHERIKPADWKRELGLPMGKQLTQADKKRNSREFATRLWPDHAHNWAKTSQDGLAEAALIAECARRRLLGS
jgi:hypothetical protein